MDVPGRISDPRRIETCEVRFAASDGVILNAHLVRPKAPGKWPGLIILHTGFGLVEHIKDVGRRFANIGFISLAPNLYTRVGDPDPSDFNSIIEKMVSIDDSQLVRDLEGAAALLRKQPANNGKVGCLGFCMGGRAALLFGISSTSVDAVVDCWGGFISYASADARTTRTRPRPPIELIDRLVCPLYGVFAGEDDNPSPDEAAKMMASLERAGKGLDVKLEVFENAPHAFFADHQPSFRRRQAFELWLKMVSFLNAHLS